MKNSRFYSLAFFTLLILLTYGAHAQVVRFETILEKVEQGKLEEVDQLSRKFKTTNQAGGEVLYEVSQALLEFTKFKFNASLHHLIKAEKVMDAAQLQDPLLRARLLHIKGLLFLKGFNKASLAEIYLKEALQLYSTTACAEVEYARIYFQLARAAKELGDPETTKYYLFKSLGILERHEAQSALLIADNLNTLGIVYLEENKLPESIQQFNKALSLLKKYKWEENLLASKILDNFGIVFLYNNEVGKGLVYFKKSIRIAQTSNHSGYWISNSCLNLGDYYHYVNNSDSAKYYYTLALHERQKVLEPYHPEISFAFYHLASLYRSEKKFDSANYFISKAILPISTLLQDRGKSDKLDLDKFLLGLAINAEKTQIILDQFKEDSSNLENLKATHEDYKIIQRLSQQFITTFFWESSKTYLYDQLTLETEKALEVAYILFKQTKEKKYVQDVMHFIERNKAQLLLQNLSLQKTFEKDQDLYALRRKELALKQRLQAAKIAMEALESDDKEQTDLKSSRQHYLALRDSVDDYLEYLQKKQARYYKTRFAKPEETLVVSPTLENAILYFYGKKNIFSITIEGRLPSHIYKTPIEPSFTSNLKNLLDLVRKPPSLSNASALALTYDSVAFDIYAQLLQKPLNHLNSTSDLLIIPDGLLFALPFEALTQQLHKNPTFSSLHYVQNQHSLSYGYSLGTLSQPVSTIHATDTVIAVGYEKGNALINSPLEVNDITSSFTVEKMMGTLASKANVLHALEKNRIVHFAVHGQSSPTENNGYLLLPNQDTLFTQELYDKIVRAKLVTLHACETSVGQVNTSEGMLSMTRAFLFSGAESVIANLWMLDDLHARKNMGYFYSQLQQNPSAKEALTLAKRAAIAEGDGFTAHPFFWASTVYYGNGHASKKSSWLLPLFISCSVALTIFVVRLRNNRKKIN